MEPIIEVKNVSYQYPLTDKLALDNVSCKFEQGKCYGIVGANAGGKTTLCNLIRGLVPHFYAGELKGDAFIFGKDVREWDEMKLSVKIGYVFQDPFAQISGVKQTVFEEIGIGLENLGIEHDAMIKKIIKIAGLLKIDYLFERNPMKLSGGQCQRVAFASVLVLDSDIIVIDEPTSQLDPEGSKEVFDIVKQLKENGKTVIIAEHKIDLLARYCDEIITMKEGKIIASGTTKEVLGNIALMEQGITVPQTVRLADKLKREGIVLPDIPLTREEAISLLKERGERHGN